MGMKDINWKARCIKDGGIAYVKGEIIEVKNGIVINDIGGCNTASCEIYPQLKSFEEWNKWSDSEWEEIKDDLRELIKPCYAVKLADGTWYIAFMMNDGKIVLNKMTNIAYVISNLEEYSNDLHYICYEYRKYYDIVEIRGYSKRANQTDIENRPLIWKREEKSESDIEIEKIQAEMDKLKDRLDKIKEGK